MQILDAIQAGASGDGATDNSRVLQRALDQIAAAGGGRLTINCGGTYLCGPLRIGSGTEIHLEHGSCLLAIPDPAAYPEPGITTEGRDGRKWLWAENAERIAFTGLGAIDGQGVKFMSEAGRYIFKAVQGRPFVLNLEGCRHVTMRDFTIRDAPFWTMHLAGCEDVDISGIRILNDLRFPNNDGINPNRCKKVRITNCHIEAGDDAICLKSISTFAHYGACEDIIVSDCILTSTSSALKLGTGSFGDFRNILFNNCIVRRSSRGVALFMRDGGLMENLTVSNLQIETRLFNEAWWGSAEPVYINISTRTPESRIGAIRNLRFSNIQCRSENGVYVGGHPGAPDRINGVRFEGVNVELTRMSRYERGFVDNRPTSEADSRVAHPPASFTLRDASNIHLIDCGGSEPFVKATRIVGLKQSPRA